MEELLQLKTDLVEQRNALDERINKFEEHIENRDADSAKEVKEEIADIKERIAEIEDKIAELEAKLKQEEEQSQEQEEEQSQEQEEEQEERSTSKGDVIEMEERQILNTEGDIKMEQRQAFIKVLQGKADAEERALVNASEGNEGGYLVPEEIKTDINDLKRNYKSAKDIVDVIPTSTDKGSFVMEEGANLTQLVNFDEDNEGLAEQAPTFKNVAYQLANYGAVTPISNSFLQDETGGFLAYLNRLFARKAIHTENTKIFAEAKKGKTAVKVSSMGEIKAELHKLDPAIVDNAVVAVNQTAFGRLDAMEDENGRGLLQPNPADATQMTLFGRPVHVFSDAEMPNVGGRGAMYIGDLNEGIKFFDRGVYEVAISTEAGFTRNQTVARCVERFDVKQGDKDAYAYIEVEAPATGTEV